ncbi:MAG: hypothetical protein HZA50_19195 [Planctomycetes bacterium]|nr:hypothetical protein [Planctomycetota bacterium]
MKDMKKRQNLLFPEPCRKKVDRKWVKQALSAFVGACGTAATAAVVSIAVSQSSLMAQQPPPPPGAPPAKHVVTTQPASRPATQPASQPAQLTPQQKADAEKLVEKLDSDQVATREAATKQLKEIGMPVVAFLKEVSTNRKLSSEAAARVQAIIESFNPPVNSLPPVLMHEARGKMIERRLQPPPPVEN